MSKPSRRHLPFFVAFALGALVFLAGLWLWPKLAVEAGASAFFLVYLAMTLAAVPGLTADVLEKSAQAADVPIWIFFAVTLGTVAVAMGSLFMAINGQDRPGGTELALTLAAVPLGWLTIHVMTALHYAHLYWLPGDQPSGKSRGKARQGLEFPGTPRPGAWDFLYFSFVVGMTAQTSDVAITDTAMRRVNLLHAIVSFLFNTVLVAAAVNVAVSFGGGG